MNGTTKSWIYGLLVEVRFLIFLELLLQHTKVNNTIKEVFGSSQTQIMDLRLQLSESKFVNG